jgi:hypothetical protein
MVGDDVDGAADAAADADADDATDTVDAGDATTDEAGTGDVIGAAG